MQYDELVKNLMDDLKPAPEAGGEKSSEEETAGEETPKVPEAGDEAGGAEVTEPVTGAEGEAEDKGEAGKAD